MRPSAAAALWAAFMLIVGLAAAADSKAAPNVTLKAADGSAVRLSDYVGHVVVIDFWASWCPPCKSAFPALDALYREYESRGLQVLAVNVDERQRDADAFLREHPHTMPVFFDPRGESPGTFGVKGMPTSFVIDRAGAIRFTHMGYSANISREYRQEIDLLLSERQKP